MRRKTKTKHWTLSGITNIKASSNGALWSDNTKGRYFIHWHVWIALVSKIRLTIKR